MIPAPSCLAHNFRSKLGLGCVEVTYRTTGASQAISEIASRFPEMLVGAGTVLTVDQVDTARDAGARFVVTPGFSAAVVHRCAAVGMPVIPGVCTPTEIITALDAGITTLKFFPAEVAGCGFHGFWTPCFARIGHPVSPETATLFHGLCLSGCLR